MGSRTTRLLATVLLALAAVGGCAEPDADPDAEPGLIPSAAAREARDGLSADSCLPAEALVLGPYRLWENADSALARAGTPDRVDHRWGEDDGGVHDVTTHRYPTLEFDVVRGDVDRLRTGSAALPGPLGLHAGLSRAEVESRLAELHVFVRDGRDTLDIPDCGAPSAYLTLIFSADEVDAVEIVASRP